MDKQEIAKRCHALYEDELQYAISRDDKLDLARCRARAAMRIGREMEGQDISGVWLGYVEGIARNVERGFEIDLSSGQLRLDGAIRTAALSLVPAGKAREQDWLDHDELRELKFREHAAKRARERDAIREIVDRLRAHGGDPTTIEACPDLFGSDDEEAAA